MLHLRVIVAAERSRAVVELLERAAGATNVVHLAGVAVQPSGDLVTADVANDAASLVLIDLAELGLSRDAAVTLIPVEVAESEGARRANQAAADPTGGSIVWEALAQRARESSALDGPYLTFMALSAVIATVGLLTGSVVLLIGAMIVGPDFGPLVGLCFAIVDRRVRDALSALGTLGVGLATVALTAWVATEIAVATGLAEDSFAEPVLTTFVSHPNRWSVVIALAAGAAGMLTVATQKSGALVGVLVSVTTIPAAAHAGLSVAYRDWSALGGSLLQLVVNVACIAVAGVVTLVVQRALWSRRLRAHRSQPSHGALGGRP
jgi:uncharacterized hydrophobic protein (TIGR00271 family)